MENQVKLAIGLLFYIMRFWSSYQISNKHQNMKKMFWNKEASVFQRYLLHWKHMSGTESKEKNNFFKTPAPPGFI